jgi:hypothetical protein
MKFKLLSSVIIVSFIMFFVSCTNKSGDQSTSAADSVVSESTNISSAPAVKKYDIKSGIVTYVTEVMGMKNSQTLYFDDYGATELQQTVTSIEMMGIKSRTVSVSLTKDGFKYDYELENMTNNENKLVKEIKKSIVNYVPSADMGKMAATMTDEMKKKYEYKEEGSETIAGKSGTKFSMKVGSSKITGVIYKKVMLKTEMEMMTMKAEKFEENATIPSGTFELPKDYKIVEQ